MAVMMGARKNRARHGDKECAYGCCRSYYGSKKAARRAVRSREKQEWKNDND